MATHERVDSAIIQNEPRPPAPSERRSYVYFLLFLLVPSLLAYIAAFPLVRTTSFEQWCPSQWGPVLEWAFDAKRQNADIVIFGDSSAFLGVDPRIINEQLGVRSIVLPNTVGSLPVTGDLALQQYLANNRPPKVIVFYFSTWNLDYGHMQNVKLFEGEEMILRHGSWPIIKRFGLGHPLEVLSFPLRLYSTFGPALIKSLLSRDNREHDTALAFGHVDDHDDFPAMDAPCDLPARYFESNDESSVRQLTKRFSSPETRVMIYLAPVPHCRNADSFVQQASAKLGLRPPAQLPPNGFLADGYYAHIEPASVAASSHLLVEALKSDSTFTR